MTTDTHMVTKWPKIHKYRESATCSGCAGLIQRGHYERQARWRERLARWQNKHAPFVMDDRSHENMEA